MPASRADAPRARAGLTLVAVAIAAVFASPGVYVLWRASTLGADLGELFGEAWGPTVRTVQLGVAVSLATGIVGSSLAFVLVRTDLPLRSLWRVFAPLPLVFPSFVGAAAFLAGLAPDGVLRNALELVGYHAPRRFRGFGPSVLVLTLFTYPYVYLPVAARLAALPPSLEESARLLGDGPRRYIFRVLLPSIRGSVVGGMLIVFLYSLSEFGAVQLLGYDTLTRVVYATRLVDRAQSFAAASLLLVMAIAAVLVERRVRGAGWRGVTVATRRANPIALGRATLPALGGVGVVLGLALVVPIASLTQWAWRGTDVDGDRWGTFVDHLTDVRSAAWNSAWLGVAAGVIAIAAVLPASVLNARYRSRAQSAVSVGILSGFAVPGLVIALSLAFWSLNVPFAERLYQTVPLLLAAYVVHFGSQALRATETSLASVPLRVRESSRLLGAGWLRRVATVEVPLMREGLVAGGGLVLLSAIKELPATLLLAPIGLETLTTRVWGSFEDGFLAEASIAALALLAVSGVLTWLVVFRRADHLA